MSEEKPFKNVAPSRKNQIWILALTLPFLATHFLTPVKLPWFLLTICILLVIYCLGGAFFLQKFEYGVLRRDDGFEYRAPLRRHIFIRFSEIEKITAISHVSGDDGESITHFLIASSVGKALVRCDVLWKSGLREKLLALDGFDDAAYSKSGVLDQSVWHNFFSKKTVIYRKAGV